MTVHVRELHSISELSRAEQVQKSAWGGGDLMVVPKEIMRAICSNGGIVLGAFEEDRMVGMSIALPGIKKGKAYMYSHMTGVSKEHQSRGIGFLLKKKQREISSRRGFDLVAWTFDPIIGMNAYFNFSKLGVVSRNYFVNYYGAMQDSINFGLETDRFLVESFLNTKIITRIHNAIQSDLKDAHEALKTEARDGYLRCSDTYLDPNARTVLVDIPNNIVSIKKSSLEDAVAWRTSTREVFQYYFRRGFTALGLFKNGENFRYLLKKVPLPKNIFEE